MRFLADAGVSPLTVEFLIQFGHEAVHVRTLDMQRAPDLDIVKRARADSSIVLTFDHLHKSPKLLRLFLGSA
jgi:predicted nuclease of predicted toxin-antitoxin system